MAEILVPPDVEALLVSALPPRLAAQGRTVQVCTVVPDPRPAEFVRVTAVGGVRHNLVQDRPSVVVEAWAADEYAAMSLAQLARALVDALEGETVDGVAVYRIDELAAPANLPDPTSSQTRYTFTTSLYLRVTALQPIERGT